MKGQIAALQAQVVGLRDQVVERERANAQDSAQAEGNAPRVELDGTELRKRYERLFESEIAGGEWARTERDALVNFFESDAAAGVHAEAVECRRNLCRSRLSFENRKAAERFLTNVGKPPFDKDTFWNGDEEARQLTLITTRAGYPLPDVSRQ